jgi:hypothetical protein
VAGWHDYDGTHKPEPPVSQRHEPWSGGAPVVAHAQQPGDACPSRQVSVVRMDDRFIRVFPRAGHWAILPIALTFAHLLTSCLGMELLRRTLRSVRSGVIFMPSFPSRIPSPKERAQTPAAMVQLATSIGRFLIGQSDRAIIVDSSGRILPHTRLGQPRWSIHQSDGARGRRASRCRACPMARSLPDASEPQCLCRVPQVAGCRRNQTIVNQARARLASTALLVIGG